MIIKLTSSFSLAVCLIFCLALAHSQDEILGSKCRILALEGGGDKGSFEAGALKAFSDLLKPKEIEYDVVTGVSVGSINSIGLALHDKGDEKQCVNWMNKLWLNISSSDIYSSWPLGVPQGLLFQEGIYNNANELEFLTRVINEFPDKKLKRKMEINTVDIDSGDVIHFNENEEWESLPAKVVASTAMPFAFTHSHLDNHTYIDGGSVWNLDIGKGVNRCLETHKQKDIIIDIILCSGLQIAKVNETDEYNTIQNFARYRDFKAFYGVMSDIYEIIRGYPKVTFRYLVYPTEPLPTSFIPLGFNHESIIEMIDQGYRDAEAVIKNGTHNSFDRVKEFIDDLYNKYDPAQMNRFKKQD